MLCTGSEGVLNQVIIIHLRFLYDLMIILKDYIIHLAEKLLDSRLQVVCMVARGCGGLSITTPTFVRRKTDDIREALKRIRAARPSVTKVYLVGFSLGAAQILKYVGEDGSRASIKAAVAVSPPW